METSRHVLTLNIKHKHRLPVFSDHEINKSLDDNNTVIWRKKGDNEETKVTTNNCIIIRKKSHNNPEINTIIRKKNLFSEVSENSETTNDNDKTRLVNGNPIVIKSVVKRKEPNVMSVNESSNCLPQIESAEIMTECLEILKKNDPQSELSKEELIEKVDCQKDSLIKNQKKYEAKDYALKMAAIDKILSKLKIGLADANLKEMNSTNKKIDKIVLDKKIPQEQFVKKVNLTGPRDNNDPTYHLLTNSRKYFEKMTYVTPPPEIAKLDPKNKNFGNKPMPPDLLKQINFR